MTEVTTEDEGFDPNDAYSNRRSKGLLEADVDRICKMYVAGEFQLQEGKFLTPHYMSKVIEEIDGLERGPSSGAISAIFARWDRKGYATFRKTPFAFKDFSEEGKKLGLRAYMKKVSSVLVHP